MMRIRVWLMEKVRSTIRLEAGFPWRRRGQDDAKVGIAKNSLGGLCSSTFYSTKQREAGNIHDE
jgi:hypothetical protein